MAATGTYRQGKNVKLLLSSIYFHSVLKSVLTEIIIFLKQGIAGPPGLPGTAGTVCSTQKCI